MLLSIAAGEPDVESDGIRVDAGEPGGLAGADALSHVGEDDDRLSAGSRALNRGVSLRSENRAVYVEQRSICRELNRLVPRRYGQVFVALLPMVRAVRIQTAKRGQIIHDASSRNNPS